MQLDSYQQRAVCHFKGPALVLAGPGSGKTAVLTNRVLHLVRERDIDPANILVLTFTRAAAAEMQQRYLHMAPPGLTGVTFGTFHSVFFRILRNIYGYTASDLLTDDEKRRFVRQECRRLVPQLAGDADFIRDVSSELSKCKRITEDIEFYESTVMEVETFRVIWQAYSSYLKSHHKLDYDDCILRAIQVFETRPDILEQWQSVFRFLLVDEFQDVSDFQLELVRLLAGTDANLFVVGDDDQGIYGFRGAGTGVLKKFQMTYPDCALFRLNINYRSHADIVKASRLVIEENKDRLYKDLHANTCEKCTGKSLNVVKDTLTPEILLRRLPVRVLHFDNERQEAAYIAHEILADMNERKRKGETGSLRDYAVLVRTRAIGRIYHETFLTQKIPDTTGLGKESEIRQDIFGYLRLAAEPKCLAHLLPLLNRPPRGLDKEAFFIDEGKDPYVQALRYYAWDSEQKHRIQTLQADLYVLASLPPGAAITYIKKGMGYESWISKKYRANGQDDKSARGELAALQEEASAFFSWGEWEQAQERKSDMPIGMSAEKQARIQAGTRQGPALKAAVTLTTLHASKGLEYRYVYLPAVNEGILPYSRAMTPEAIEEERRLFYVGMTRAKNRLTIMTEKERLHRPQTASRFLGCLRSFTQDQPSRGQ